MSVAPMPITDPTVTVTCEVAVLDAALVDGVAPNISAEEIAARPKTGNATNPFFMFLFLLTVKNPFFTTRIVQTLYLEYHKDFRIVNTFLKNSIKI